MILKQTALKTLLFSGMLISQTTFGTAQTSASTPFAQPQLQEQTSQQAPQEKQDEYLFKKKFRELPFGYTPLMFLYAIANGSISEEIKFAASDNSIAPFALETIDFIYDEIEDKHKDTFEWFLENLARLLTIYGTELFTNTSSKSIKLHKLSLCDGSLEEFQKGGSSAARGVIKTILRAFFATSILEHLFNKIGPCEIKDDKGNVIVTMDLSNKATLLGTAFEPIYPLLFDAIVTQLPEEAKNSTTKKRLIRGARGLIRAAVRTAIY